MAVSDVNPFSAILKWILRRIYYGLEDLWLV